MRQLFRRLRACEAGAGAVEYALLIAILALGMIGMLELFRNAVGGVTNRTAVSVSRRASGGYGVRPSGVVYRPSLPAPAEPPEADSSFVEPDSSSTTGGTAAVSSDPSVE